MSDYTFVTVNTGDSPEDTAEHWASKRFNVLGVPTVFLIDEDAEEVRTIKSRAVIPFIKEVTNG